MKSSLRRPLILLAIMLSVIVLDQWTKELVRQHFPSHQVLVVVPNFAEMMHAENSGAFLSLGASMSPTLRFLIFTVGVALFLVAGVVYVLRDRKMKAGASVSLALLLAGGIGNLIDRAQKETVTDFLVLSVGPLHTGVINLADAAITVGTLVLLAYSFLPEKSQRKTA